MNNLGTSPHFHDKAWSLSRVLGSAVANRNIIIVSPALQVQRHKMSTLNIKLGISINLKR